MGLIVRRDRFAPDAVYVRLTETAEMEQRLISEVREFNRQGPGVIDLADEQTARLLVRRIIDSLSNSEY